MDRRSEARTEASAASGDQVSDKGQILVVDDNPGIRRLLGRLLHSHRFTVLEASSVPEAVSTADQHAISAVILDLHLGSQSGLDLLERLRQDPRHAETPVLILTGTDSMSNEAETTIRRNGAQLFHKPVSLGLLVEQIERMTGDRQPVEIA